MILIGVVGFIGSGKGTAGDILSSYGFAQQAFAGPLKDAAAAMFGWDRALLEGDTDRSRLWREEPDDFWSKVMGRPFTPREALQKLGTEAGRNVFHQDLWVKTLQKRLTCDTVITDVRFQNEMDFIRQNNGHIIHVQRGKVPDWFDTAAKANSGDVKALVAMKQYGIHESEWKWIGSKIDYHIQNDGTVKDFQKELEVILYTIRRKEEYETQQ
jgi:hypothetical protein